MGTNFFLDKELTRHIGKVSAAGPYCTHCKASLCEAGDHAVHQYYVDGDKKLLMPWYDKCPSCGSKYGIGGIVVNVHSFTWAIHPLEFYSKVKKQKNIYDEYGRTRNTKGFLDYIGKMPIKFFMIGKDFR